MVRAGLWAAEGYGAGQGEYKPSPLCPAAAIWNSSDNPRALPFLYLCKYVFIYIYVHSYVYVYTYTIKNSCQTLCYKDTGPHIAPVKGFLWAAQTALTRQGT